MTSMKTSNKFFLLGNPFPVLFFRINIWIIEKQCNPEILGQIFQHITAARRTTAMEEKRRDFLLFPNALNQLFKFVLVVSCSHIFTFKYVFLISLYLRCFPQRHKEH